MLADVRPEAVLHFAAKSLVGGSQQQPEDYWHTNVGGSLALLEAMRAADCRRIVFSSTAATYGEPESVPIREDAPTRPTNTYGASKLAVDHMLTSYAVAHGFAAVSLRYFNVAGAAYGLGERHATETHLIPIALQVAAGQRESLTVFGEDYPTPGRHLHPRLRPRRATSPTPTCWPCPRRRPGEHRIYNLGNGTGFSVQEVVDAVREVTGHPVPVVVGERRAGDPAQLVASSDRIRADLGWTPKHTDLAGHRPRRLGRSRRAPLRGQLDRLGRSRAVPASSVARRRPGPGGADAQAGDPPSVQLEDGQRPALDLDGVADLRQPAELGEHVPGDRLVGPVGQLAGR